MHTRMDNPATIRPFAMDAILALHKATRQGGVPQATLELVHLPAREPDQWLQDLALTWAHAMPGRRNRRAAFRGGGLAGGALLDLCRTRRPRAHRGCHPAQRPGGPGTRRDL